MNIYKKFLCRKQLHRNFCQCLQWCLLLHEAQLLEQTTAFFLSAADTIKAAIIAMPIKATTIISAILIFFSPHISPNVNKKTYARHYTTNFRLFQLPKTIFFIEFILQICYYIANDKINRPMSFRAKRGIFERFFVTSFLRMTKGNFQWRLL